MQHTALHRLGLPLGIVLVLAFLTTRAVAFSLLGPYADWMVETNGYRQAGDIGGPMDINEEYRWNVPVVTYGFDKSFLDYFGSNGVAAVESAIQILNDLPPASSIVLSNYPLDSSRYHYPALFQGLFDLKSVTLTVLLEQLGLTGPTRHVFDLRRWHDSFQEFHGEESWGEWAIPEYIVERNFDPETLAPSRYVNEVLYSGYVFRSSSGIADVIEIPVDPSIWTYTAVTDWVWPGKYFTGLTRDDVGGLRYLLSTNNVNYERLLPGVRQPRNRCLPGVNGAWRPGVEKITFVRHPVWARYGFFLPRKYSFTDTVIKAGGVRRQQVERFLTRPDFLFCAADTGEHNPLTFTLLRTGTTRWINHAAWNGGAANAGPGVIRPPVKITFHKLGATATTGDIRQEVYDQGWGSFDYVTNPVVVYPAGDVQNKKRFTVRLRFFVTNSAPEVQLTNHTWHLRIPIGGQAALQISTNQTDWTSLAVVTNRGAVVEWHHYGAADPQKFFRVVPNILPLTRPPVIPLPIPLPPRPVPTPTPPPTRLSPEAQAILVGAERSAPGSAAAVRQLLESLRVQAEASTP